MKKFSKIKQKVKVKVIIIIIIPYLQSLHIQQVKGTYNT